MELSLSILIFLNTFVSVIIVKIIPECKNLRAGVTCFSQLKF